MELGPQQIGKILFLAGVFIVLLGVVFLISEQADLFKLPGDFVFSGKHWKIYLPLASGIVLSIVLTLIIWLINLFRK